MLKKLSGAARSATVNLSRKIHECAKTVRSLVLEPAPKPQQDGTKSKEEEEEEVLQPLVESTINVLGSMPGRTNVHHDARVALTNLRRGDRHHAAMSHVVLELEASLDTGKGLASATEAAKLAAQADGLHDQALSATEYMLCYAVDTLAHPLIAALLRSGTEGQHVAGAIQHIAASSRSCISAEGAHDLLALFQRKEVCVEPFWSSGAAEFRAIAVQAMNRANHEMVAAKMHECLRGQGSLKMLHVMKPLLLKQLTQLNELSSIIVCRDHLSARSQRQLRNITTGLEVLYLLEALDSEVKAQWRDHGLDFAEVPALLKDVGIASRRLFHLLHGMRPSLADTLGSQSDRVEETVGGIAAAMPLLVSGMGQVLRHQADTEKKAEAAQADAKAAREEVAEIKALLGATKLAELRGQAAGGQENELPAEGAAAALGGLDLNGAGPLRTVMRQQP